MRHNDRGCVFAPSPLSKSFFANGDSISATSQAQMMSAPRLLLSASDEYIAKYSSDIGKADTQTFAPKPTPMAIDPDNFMSLKVTELRAELRARGLPCKGLKQELADRLKEAKR
jgi:hypothetical protein